MAKVFELRIPPTDKLVMLAFADHADDDGYNCFPSVGGIADKTGLTRRGVQKVIRRQKKFGRLVDIGIRPSGTIEYRIVLHSGSEPGSQGSEHSSLSERGSLRIRFRRGANQSAKPSEYRSPESSVTVIEPSGMKNSDAPPQSQVPPASADSIEVAAAVGLSVYIVQEAIEIKRTDPALFEMIKAGGVDWLPLIEWNAWLEMRRANRWKLTDHARALAIRKLDELRKQGHDPAQVLNQSVLNSWRGLFPIKADFGGRNGRRSRAEERTRRNLLACGFNPDAATGGDENGDLR